MDCIYLNCGNNCFCHAVPIRQGETIVYFKPTEDELKSICKNGEKFSGCPRLNSFEYHVKVAHSE
jgi:hypothetical protein